MTTTKKTTTKPKTEEVVVENDTNELVQQLLAQIAEQNKKMEEMQKQLASQSSQTITVEHTESKLGAKKIKCVNAYNGMLNVSTEPYGQGRSFSFEKFGDTRLIRFDDLADCVASYPKTFEKGYVLIANKDAVEALGLSDDYATMFDINALKDVVKMNEQKHFDIFTGLDETMQKSFARDIAERINNKEAVDFNLVSKIKDECNIDIQKIAGDLVLASKKKDE